nr:MAG TPA: LETHAL(3)MALIGNANT BRAIN TUMOR-LIKE 2 PROTEIN, LMBL2, NUCLEUS, ZINC-FINGER, RNA [Caudoviricetes sp.]
MAKCKICGKTTGSFSIAINPRDDVPEIKRTVRLCSRRCANVFSWQNKSLPDKKVEPQ